MYCSKQLVVAGVLLVVAVAAVGGSVQPPTGGPAESPQETTIRFEDVSEEVGPAYEAKIDGADVSNTISNAGVYAADVDRDGWTDLLAVGGERPVLFENDRGEFRRTEAVPRLDRSVRSALFVDYDTDGWEDLLLVSEDREPLLLENDRGTFDRVDAGFDREFAVPIGATAADYDRDGCLDLFVVQNGRWSERPPLGMNDVSVPLDDDNGKPNALFEGTCSGFERAEDGDIAGTRWSLATSFVDLTADGYPDIHVANDFNNDTMYVNRGDGTFERRVMGAATSRNGMSSEVGDFDGDARPDVFVTNIFFPISEANISDEKQQRLERYFAFVLRSKRIEGNNLMINRGGGEMSFESTAYGIAEGGWGWASAHVDLDNDGDRDLFHATQEVLRIDEEDPTFTYPMVFERDGDSFERRDASEMGFSEANGRGIAQLDFDRDGDQDLLVSTYDGSFELYANTADSLEDRHSLQLRVVAANGETTAIGAEVAVTANGTTQSAALNAKADYQSQDTRVLHFGLGATGEVDRVTVTWPDGTEHVFEDVEADQRLVAFRNGTINTAPGS